MTDNDWPRAVSHRQLRRAQRALLLAAWWSGAFGAAHEARAEDAPVADRNRAFAQELFDQAKQLMADGRYGKACPKLAASQRLDPAGGTLLNLALCHEKEGKLVAARTEFEEALGVAHRAGRADRERAALAHIAAIQLRLARLTRKVQSGVPAPTVKPDTQLIGSPVVPPLADDDTGTHRKTSPLGTAPSTAHGTDRVGRPPAMSRQTASYVVGSIGLAAIGVGSAFGIRAVARRQASDSLCPTDDTCSSAGMRLNNEARTAARVADVFVGAGIVGIAVAAYLFFTPSPSRSRSKAFLTPQLGAAAPGLEIVGSW
jgi:hypothetical protein